VRVDSAAPAGDVVTSLARLLRRLRDARQKADKGERTSASEGEKLDTKT
jgi:hypothetical protein